MAKESKVSQPMPPVGKWAPAVALAWFVPGGGHFLLGKRGRGALIAFAVVVSFVFGLLLRGAFFEPMTGDLLTTVIYYGGHLANMMAGVLYFLASWFGYNQVDVAGHVHDYGTKFLVGAGLMNVLAMVDVYEIAAGRKS